MKPLVASKDREGPGAAVVRRRAAANGNTFRSRIVSLERCAVLTIFIEERAPHEEVAARTPVPLNSKIERLVGRGRLLIDTPSLFGSDYEIAVRVERFTSDRDSPGTRFEPAKKGDISRIVVAIARLKGECRLRLSIC
jgi:hypothetical protein